MAAPRETDAVVRLSLVRCRLPLTAPYVLSFASLDAFDTYYVVADANGQRGWGEVTPLPGYGGEAADMVERVFAAIAKATDGRPSGAAALSAGAPFLASAIDCAMETLGKGSVWGPVEGSRSLAAFCSGSTPAASADNARGLTGDGFRVLKLKIGRDTVDQDLQRVRAVCKAIPAGTTLRLDANQALVEPAAAAMCAALDGLPVALLEQPFPPDAWDASSRLAARTQVPLMLDESIWTESDLDRAVAAGARLVKFKLCKHRGLEGTRRMIRRARKLGLGVVFGNGVQSALGNHLEVSLHAEMNLETAGEFNGFAKVAVPYRSDCMTVADGKLRSGGVEPDRLVAVSAPARSLQPAAARL